MATGSNTYEGLAVPLLGESEIVQQTAANDILTIRQASASSGDALVIRNSASNNQFGVNSLGQIRTMVLATVALASLTTNASQSVSLSGATTNDVALLFPTAGTVTGNGTFVAQVLTADKLTVFNASALSTAATTAVVWYFKTKST